MKGSFATENQPDPSSQEEKVNRSVGVYAQENSKGDSTLALLSNTPVLEIQLCYLAILEPQAVKLSESIP